VDVKNKISWQKKMEGERSMRFQGMLEEFHHYKTNLAQLVLSSGEAMMDLILVHSPLQRRKLVDFIC